MGEFQPQQTDEKSQILPQFSPKPFKAQDLLAESDPLAKIAKIEQPAKPNFIEESFGIIWAGIDELQMRLNKLRRLKQRATEQAIAYPAEQKK